MGWPAVAGGGGRYARSTAGRVGLGWGAPLPSLSVSHIALVVTRPIGFSCWIESVHRDERGFCVSGAN